MNRHRPGYFKEYYASHSEACKSSQRRYRQRTPRIHKPDTLRESRLLYLYKMTVDMYESLLSLQNGHCALCQAVQGDSERRMAVDHNHECCSGKRSCGKCLRGILCANCNRKIGFLEQLLKDALSYHFIPDSWTGRALRYLLKYQGETQKCT